MLNRIVNFLILVLFLAGLFLQPIPAAAQVPEEEISRDTLYVPGEVIVSFPAGLTANDYTARASALADEAGALVVNSFENLVLLSFAEDADVNVMVDQLTAQGVTAQLNYISWIPEADPLGPMYLMTESTSIAADGTVTTTLVSVLAQMRSVRKVGGQTATVPTYPNDAWTNWGFDFIQADFIWPTTNTSPTVCVIDTGVDGNHPDLKGKVVNGKDFVNNDTTPNDDNGHGTHVAGIIAAKNNNGSGGMAGVSNGKVLAVKALGAQGWGTSFNIIAAINYCANNTSVKVINMSLESSVEDATQKDALNYAINTKGKLVVAAAGNSSKAYNPYPTKPAYPAGWATDATIGAGLISVAASRPYDDEIWVDTDGDEVHDGDENYAGCATEVTNYGVWVEMIAPGQGILSTTPVSYPFYENWYHGATTPYDSWSGTSMAAPFVAATAARAWSVNTAFTNLQIAALLYDTGQVLSYLSLNVDPDVPFSAIDIGYAATGYDGDAPFCWPNTDGNYDSVTTMENARRVNVAAAMGRAGIRVDITEATTGLPLKDVSVMAYNAGNQVKDTAKSTATATAVDLINLPANTSYTVRVNKSGYTSGTQTVSKSIDLGASGPGLFVTSTIDYKISLAPARDFQIVLNHTNEAGLYVFLPAAQNATVGPGDAGSGGYDGQGALTGFPFAFWHISEQPDDVGVNVVTVQKSPSGSYPYFNSASSSQYYDIFVHGDGISRAFLVRVWQSGVVKMQLKRNVVCAAGETWWHAARFFRSGSSTFYEVIDDCGTNALWPYSYSDAISTTNDAQP